MDTLYQEALSTLQNLPDERRADVSRLIIDVAMPTIQFTDEQLAGIDTALAELDAGQRASETEIEAAFATFRRI